MTLTEFLLARIAEEEALAREADVKQHDPDWFVSEVMALAGELFTVRSVRDSRPIARVQRLDGDEDEHAAILDGRSAAEHIARWDVTHVLAECEAKRRIVDIHQGSAVGYSTFAASSCLKCGWFGEYDEDWPCETIKALATPYADHPDYLEEWRP